MRDGGPSLRRARVAPPQRADPGPARPRRVDPGVLDPGSSRPGSRDVGVRDLGELDDDVLTDRACDGDTRAFEVLVRRYQARMFGHASRLTGSSADAEDVVSIAFTTVWRALPTFRRDSSFSTWLYRIVTNEATSLLRRRRPHADWPDEDGPADADHRGPECRAQVGALGEALAAALAELPHDLRVVWLLREIEHRGYDEVAQIVDVPTSTVRGRLARARAALALALADWR